MVKKAIILIAGREKKLAPLTDDIHQCLFVLKNSTVIEDMLSKLSRQGVREVTLVVGHKADMVKKTLGNRYGRLRIKYIFNKDYSTTNVIYSLWLARKDMKDGFLLIDGDLICEEELLKRMIRSNKMDLIAVDYSQRLSKAHVIAKVVRDRVAALSKNMDTHDDAVFGRSIGIGKFSAATGGMLVDEITAVVKKGGIDLYYEDALNNILPKIALYTMDVRGLNWIEIDRTEQFEKAKKIFGDIVDLKKKAVEYGADDAFTILPKDLIFDSRAILKCFNCEKYSTKWTCPPKSPMIDYRQLIMKYEKAIIVVVKANFTEEKFNDTRQQSSNKLHRILLRLEKDGFDRENHFTIAFIGGSCKLCKSDCSKSRCRYPKLARIPIEATGVDVIKTLDKYGLNLKFPVKEYFYRVGLLMVG
ncbi:MAG TPA: DUF2284 domain-containing protein [Candidatus Omnitrophota bacterium]|nr:DUF2284 domain-containing protein [Candidatus Omnitrophota bacterium]